MIKLRCTLHIKHPQPFNYYHSLARLFHKMLPDNEVHSEQSMYSISNLIGKPNINNNKLYFPEHRAEWQVGFFDDDLAQRFMVNVISHPEWSDTLDYRVEHIERIRMPVFSSTSTVRFTVHSPVFLKKTDKNGSVRHIIFSDEDADEILTASVHARLSALGFKPGIELHFDRSYRNAKTALVDIKGIGNRASFCPVIATGSRFEMEFIWACGIGSNTGVGFGALQ